jgi:hypothetical protein
MPDSARLARAVHLVVESIGTETWRVSGGVTDHVVTGDRCDCTDYLVRGGRCKHILSVMLFTGDREVLYALREVVPLPSRSRRARAISAAQEGQDPLPIRPTLVPEAGALSLWWAEIREGKRTKHTADSLQEAAQWEARGRSDLQAGDLDGANESRRKAAAILVRRFVGDAA